MISFSLGFVQTPNDRVLRSLPTACKSVPTPPPRRRSNSSRSSRTSTSTPYTRGRFEDLCQDLLHSTLEVDKSRVYEIVIVGSSSRIPRIVKLVSDLFDGKEPNKSINPDEAVAYGATIQADIPSGDSSEQTSEILLLDVAPLPRYLDRRWCHDTAHQAQHGDSDEVRSSRRMPTSSPVY